MERSWKQERNLKMKKSSHGRFRNRGLSSDLVICQEDTICNDIFRFFLYSRVKSQGKSSENVYIDKENVR